MDCKRILSLTHLQSNIITDLIVMAIPVPVIRRANNLPREVILQLSSLYVGAAFVRPVHYFESVVVLMNLGCRICNRSDVVCSWECRTISTASDDMGTGWVLLRPSFVNANAH